MKKPIIINNSILEFVVIGPLISSDGIIIQSENAASDLIGSAYTIYYDIKDQIHSIEGEIFYLWGGPIQIEPNSNRKSRILFCWRGATLGMFSSRNDVETEELEQEFNAFLDNSYSVLKKFCRTNYQESIYDEVLYTLKWTISPFLLKAHIQSH